MPSRAAKTRGRRPILFSHPKDGAYVHSAAVRLGEPLHIPEPVVDFVLDTANFLDG